MTDKKPRRNKWRRRLLIFFILITIILGFIAFYCCSGFGVHPTTLKFHSELKKELIAQGHRPSIFIVSGKRWHWHNWILSEYGGAAKNSRHLKGQAVDIFVLDVNKDGKANAKDVDIVYQILDKKVIKSKGGIGTYKHNSTFFDRQMVHFDCRGKRARWHR